MCINDLINYAKVMDFIWKIKPVILYACTKSMFTKILYSRTFWNVPSLRISFSLYSWLVISVTVIALSIDDLFLFVSHVAPKLINLKHLKSIFIILRNEFVEEGCTVIFFECPMIKECIVRQAFQLWFDCLYIVS